MSLQSLASLDGSDLAAFVVCGFIGYFVGSSAVPGSVIALYGSILVSYHLFLAWLVFFSPGHREAGAPLPFFHTLITHAACLVVILGPIAIARRTIPAFAVFQQEDLTAGMDSIRASIRIFQVLSSAAAGLAVFERGWLFTNEPQPGRRPEPQAPPSLPMGESAQEAEDWHRYLAEQPPGAFRRTSLKAEYEKWLAARRKNHPAP